MNEKNITAAHKAALARMYADEHLRSYFSLEIQHQNENAVAALDKGRPEEAARYAQRLKVFQDIMERGKYYFSMVEKLRTEELTANKESHENTKKDA